MKATLKMNRMLQIPLASAYLCTDCNCIGNCADRCPLCASQVLLGLASVLNREVKAESEALPMMGMVNHEAGMEAGRTYDNYRSIAA